MVKNSKTVLMFFVILLVCSITPAMAVQTDQGSMSTETYAQLYEHVHSIFSMISDEFNTEITDEQLLYLETHSEQIESKGIGSLNNLQDFFDYFSTISPDITTNNSNSNTKNLRSNTHLRSNTDKYTEDVNYMKKYLETRGALVEIKNLDYKGLSDYIGDNMVRRDSIIVQIHDTDGYIRYMKLTDFVYTDTDDHIELVSGNINHPDDKEGFEKKFVWHNDGSYSNPDRKFNIIITSTPGCRNYVLRNIWDKQYHDLVTKISHLDNCLIFFPIMISLGFGSITIVGVYELVAYMKKDKKDKKKAVEVGMAMTTEAAKVVPLDQQPLLASIPESYGAVKDAGANKVNEILPQQEFQKRACNYHMGVILGIMASGIVIGTSGIYGLVCVRERKVKFNEELENNLNYYKPPPNVS